MRLKIKRQGLLGTEKRAFRMTVDEVVVKANPVDMNVDIIQLFVKGETASGILEFKKDELKPLAKILEQI